MISYIQDNISSASEYLEEYDVALTNLTMEEIYSVYLRLKEKETI